MSENVTKGLDEQYCSSCGSIIKIAAEICPKCGVRQKPATSSGDPNASDKSRTVTLLFCIFLGSMGVHNFYTGKIVIGIIQLLMLIVGTLTVMLGIGIILLFALGVWVLIDFIFIVAGLFKDEEDNKILNW